MKIVITLLVILCVLTSTVDAKKKNKNKRAKFQTQILNGEEENSPAKCAKVCSGTTERQDAEYYEDYGEEVSVDVDMTQCGFVKIPNVVISIEGSTRHLNFSPGTSSVFNTTSTGFKVYLNDEDAYDESKLNIDWVAVGFTC